jgi:hypothetical protein
MVRRALLPCLLAALPLAGYGQISYSNRTSTYQIDPGTSSFGNASAFYSVGFDLTATNQGDSGTGDFAVKSGYSNFQVANTGGAVTTIDPTTGVGLISFPTSNLSGTTTFSYDTGATGFGSSFLQQSSANDLSTLEFSGGGFGIVEAGTSFNLHMTIDGNWTNMGTSSGDLQLLGYNPEWTAPTFTYLGGQTIVNMYNGDFDGSSTSGPSLDFKLYGAPVPTPTPAVWLGFSFGIVALGLPRLRKAKRLPR